MRTEEFETKQSSVDCQEARLEQAWVGNHRPESGGSAVRAVRAGRAGRAGGQAE